MSTTGDRNTRIRQAIWDSGLWASYGDAAAVMDGYHGRSLGQANWDRDRWTHLARADGTYDAETTSRERDFQTRRKILAVQGAFGYRNGDPKPAQLRLSETEIRMLIGEIPSTATLRLRLGAQLDVILAVADTLEADDPDYDPVWDAVDRLRALIAAL